MDKPILDRRVARTRQMLRDALFSLIEERGYDTLSVQDITERANIGRTTFYVHYPDKEQLLLNSVKALLTDLHAHTQPLSTTDLLEKRETLSIVLFRHVQQYASLYRALLSERGAALIITRLRNDVSARIQYLVTNQLLADAPNPLPGDMLAEYCASALWGLVTWWLTNNFPKTPEEMGLLYWHLINQGLPRTLGLTEGETAK